MVAKDMYRTQQSDVNILICRAKDKTIAKYDCASQKIELTKPARVEEV